MVRRVGDIDKEDLTPHFAEVTEAPVRIDHPFARADERDLPIFICRHPNQSLAEKWPRLKHYR